MSALKCSHHHRPSGWNKCPSQCEGGACQASTLATFPHFLFPPGLSFSTCLHRISGGQAVPRQTRRDSGVGPGTNIFPAPPAENCPWTSCVFCRLPRGGPRLFTGQVTDQWPWPSSGPALRQRAVGTVRGLCCFPRAACLAILGPQALRKSGCDQAVLGWVFYWAPLEEVHTHKAPGCGESWLLLPLVEGGGFTYRFPDSPSTYTEPKWAQGIFFKKAN